MSPSQCAPTQSPESDALNEQSIRLMSRVATGDHAAFSRLVKLHHHRVVGTVAKMLENPSDAEDVAQQVFLRVWKAARAYEPRAKFTTWLFTITRNLVFNELRRQQRKPAESLEERQEQHWSTPCSPKDAPDQSTMRQELERHIADAVAALPEKQRIAVVLRRYEELSYDEIARTLGLSLPAVKSLLFRGRAQLRKALQGYWEPA